MTKRWAAAACAGGLLVGALPGCYRDSRVNFAPELISSAEQRAAEMETSRLEVTLGELEKGDDLKIEFADASRHFVTLDLDRVEVPLLIGTVGRYDAELDEWTFEPGRIDLHDARAVWLRESNTGHSIALGLGAVALLGFFSISGQ